MYIDTCALQVDYIDIAPKVSESPCKIDSIHENDSIVATRARAVATKTKRKGKSKTTTKTKQNRVNKNNHKDWRIACTNCLIDDSSNAS